MASILCVEDESDFREELAEALVEQGYSVLEASNGEEGLELMREHCPDLVLCDRMMPKMSGTDLLRTIRENHPELAPIPFVFMSALGDRRDIHGTADLVPAAYITKPVDFDALGGLIEKILQDKKPA